MKKVLLRLTLSAIIIYLTGGTLNPAVTASPPSGGNGTHVCGVIENQWNKQLSDQYPNRRYRTAAANLSTGEPRTVRMIYFLPNDRPYRADVVQQMKDEILNIQTFFAEQMNAYGYGKKTFHVETDSQGEPMVHRVNREQPDSHYLYNSQPILDEIQQSFDLNMSIYLIVIDNSVEEVVPDAIGVGGRYGKNGGFALVNEQFSRPNAGSLATHELGHAFGLLHDFRDSAYIMSYGPQWSRLSACNAEYLSVHPYFNPDIPIEEGPPSSIKLISPRSYPAGSQSVSVQLEVSDSDGLHQVLLHGPDGLIDCRGLTGTTDRLVKFDYDGVFIRGDYSRVSNLGTHLIVVEVVDTDGNSRSESFSITIEPSEVSGPEAQVNIPDSNLRTAIATTLGKSPSASINRGNMADLTELIAIDANISDLTGLEYAIDLWFILNLEGNNISDISPVSDLTALTHLLLGGNNISDISPVSGLTALQVLNLQRNNISDISAVMGLTFLDVLRLQHNNISNISALAGLTRLDALDLQHNNISNISSVSGLTNLAFLQLGYNNISNISPVSGLTNLIELNLRGNNISDISALMGLTTLGTLNIRENNISNISPVSGLTNLRSLDIANNNISDISELAGLINLTFLNINHNSISDISSLVANTGLGSRDTVYLIGNPLSYQSIYTHIPALERRGVTVEFENRTPAIPLKISGDNQQGAPGTILEQPLVVEIRDQNGQAFAGVPVTFAVTAGGGTLNITSTMADANGRAESTLTLGGNPGINIVEVSVKGISQTAVFSAEATSPLPIPTTLEYVSGDNQSGLISEVLALPFVVEVRDQYDAPMEGVTLTFAVSIGGGSLSDTNVDSDVNGLARSTLTLGSDPVTNIVAVSVKGIAETVTFHAVAELLEFNLALPLGISLIHVPLKVRTAAGVAKTIESIGDLYDALGGAGVVNFLITYDSQTQEWLSYFGTSDTGTLADRTLSDDTGIIAGMIRGKEIRLGGDALGTNGSTITLNQGLNLVGLPLNDSRIARVSDLLMLEGIAGNVPVIILTDGGEFKLVGRAGDPGDIEIIGGQAFIMTASREATVDISGAGWTNASGTAAAPPVTLKGIEVKNTTPVLGLRGAVVDEGMGLSKGSFRVTVENLSTDRAVAAVTTLNDAGYRSTVVDIETGRAATVGDVLEISAQSPNPFIGVEPLRYTITAEDVKHSLIQLPELVAYEIPAETQLLSNYPNPFNPETWMPYHLSNDSDVLLSIYDINGALVRELDLGHQRAGYYTDRSRAAYWNGRNGWGERVASGVYFYQLRADDYSAPDEASGLRRMRKMVILK